MNAIPYQAALSIGGISLPLSGLKILKTSLSANAYSVFYDHSLGATPGIYSVPAGKSFRLWAARVEFINAAAAGVGPTLMYADTNGGLNFVAAPTNPVGLLSGIAGTPTWSDIITTGEYNSDPRREVVLGGKAPASKFVILGNGPGAGCMTNVVLYGYEV